MTIILLLRLLLLLLTTNISSDNDDNSNNDDDNSNPASRLSSRYRMYRWRAALANVIVNEHWRPLQYFIHRNMNPDNAAVR